MHYTVIDTCCVANIPLETRIQAAAAQVLRAMAIQYPFGSPLHDQVFNTRIGHNVHQRTDTLVDPWIMVDLEQMTHRAKAARSKQDELDESRDRTVSTD